ncbi:MAG: integrase core domain-containing protein [Elusimicrobiota bacterium]
MEAMHQAASKGMSLEKACEVLDLPRRRYYRWRSWQAHAPKQAWNRMLSGEKEAILSAAGREDLAHLRTAGLMVWGHESGQFHASLSSVYNVLKEAGLVKPYDPPKRKKPTAPQVRHLMDRPLRIAAYDDTDFRTVSGVIVKVILILDMGSRKLLHSVCAIRAIAQKDVKRAWDETLRQEGLSDASDLTILSDRGGAMKGRETKRHLQDRWFATLVYARPYTPDDNAWIEALIKTLKYHPECPEVFETVLDVQEWMRRFQKLYNDHPHSALKYVTPNQEHQGMGGAIRSQRKENLVQARRMRLAAYKDKKREGQECPRTTSGAPGYGSAVFRGSNRKFGGLEKEEESKKRTLEPQKGRTQVEAAQEKILNSSEKLCRF